MTQRYDPQVEEARLRFPKALKGLTDSEIRILLSRTGSMRPETVPSDLADAADRLRKNRTPPTGTAYEQAFARRGGKEFEGGPVCWNPSTECDGTCLACPTKADAS